LEIFRNDKDNIGDVRTKALHSGSFSPLNYKIASGLATKKSIIASIFTNEIGFES
jgi:hypothetical protein